MGGSPCFDLYALLHKVMTGVKGTVSSFPKKNHKEYWKNSHLGAIFMPLQILKAIVLQIFIQRKAKRKSK
jgi:hypothetical protein